MITEIKDTLCFVKFDVFSKEPILDESTQWERLIRTLLVLCIVLRESGLASPTV